MNYGDQAVAGRKKNRLKFRRFIYCFRFLLPGNFTFGNSNFLNVFNRI